MHCKLSAARSPRAWSGRLVPACFLSCLQLLSPAVAAAADGSLPPVVVTGTREPEALGRSTSDIVVIDAETIRNTSADSLEDLIRRSAGMQLVRTGGPGQSTGFFVRGASTNSTVVLVDGVRIGSATLGQAEFEALSLAQIERIEVLRGPASSLYGADAVGGVVQIFTRRGDGPPRFGAAGEIGGYGSRRANVDASGSSAAFDYALSLGRESSHGVSSIVPNDIYSSFNPDRDGYTRNSGTVRLGYAPAAGHRVGVSLLETHLDAHYDGVEFLPPNFLADASPDFRSRLTTRVASVDYRGAITGAWTTTVQGSRSLDDLRSGGTTTSRFLTRRDQATWQNALKLDPEQQLVVAFERLLERVGGDAFPDGMGRSNNAAVVGYSGRIGAHALQLDARRDDNSVYGGNTTGRVGYGYDIVSGLRVRALAGTTFRAPTFNDLFFPFYGVATTRPEHGRSVEVGVSWQGATARASATVWRNRVRDLITYQPDRTFCPPGPEFNFGCAGNIGRARLQGATFAAGERWRGFDVRLGVDLLDARDADTGVRLTRRAAHQESLDVDYEEGAWRFGAAALFVGSRPDAGIVLGGYGTLDLRASRKLDKAWRIEAKLLNALDHQIEPVRDYRGLGRQGWIGVRYDSAGL